MRALGRMLWRAFVALGECYAAGAIPDAPPPPAHDPPAYDGPPPGHPERLVPFVAPTPVECLLWMELELASDPDHR